MNIFYVPYVYSFYTRIKNPKTILSFFITFLFPVYFLTLFSSDWNISTLEFVFSFLILFLVYEIGYIFNDFHTTLFEEKPTHRIHSKEIFNFNRTYPFQIACRLFILFILFRYIGEYINPIKLLIFMLCLNLSYTLHNFYRDYRNIFTIFFLMIFKYLSIPFSTVNSDSNLYILISFILLVPLVRAVLFTVHPRINIDWFDKEDINNIRFKYYTLVSFISLIISFFIGSYYVILVLSLIFSFFYSIPCLLGKFNARK